MKLKNKIYATESDYTSFTDKVSSIYSNNHCTNCSNDTFAKNITFVVTKQCNLRCTYCYQPNKCNTRMTKSIAKDAVDFILSENINNYFDNSGACVLEFIGGEPFLEIELIDYIVDYFEKTAISLNHKWSDKFMISISTNGILFNTPKVQKFINKNKDRLSIGITIDGNKDLHDKCRVFEDGRPSYDIVEKSYKTYLDSEKLPSTKLTLSPDNIKYLYEGAINLLNMGTFYLFANCCFEEGWTTDHAKILYTQMKKLSDFILENDRYREMYCTLFSENIGFAEDKLESNWCGGNGNMLAIGPDGRCFPCIRFMDYCLETKGRKEMCIGDIYNGLKDKNSDPELKHLCSITMLSQSNEKCLNCKIGKGCSLCTGYNYDKFGDPNIRATFICEMHQARVLACRYHFQRLYKKLNLDKEFELNIPKDWALNIIDEEEYNMLLSL